ncbi:hypothetical protein EZV62_009025 [Acer yangbiense]|uniref:Uncharacterized protein n=1 Tax=Acer yangbiense TaxID=1000413 RepID=A0A5C7IEJ9_9ROSI|nr:hypothetical protein EZV62_009025 [Acer yangbiense]
MAAERINSRRDIISSLPCELLSYIFGFLPFKEAARTSILSTKFRHIWHGIDRIDLQENYFIQDDETERNKMNQRREFINFAFHCWSKNFTAKTINAFSLAFTRPRNFYVETYNLIRFSVARNVKALTLDFHNPIWREDGLENHGGVFDLPVFVYSYQGFESLKLFSCNFLASEFRNYTALKELSLGWIQLGPNSVRTLLMYCPLLESFSLKKCWNIHERLDISRPNLRLKNLVVDRCNFLSGLVRIQAPNLRFFKYSGKVARFNFESRLTYMQEAELDFGQQSEFSGVADLLYDLIDQLFSVRVLTVCSFLLQVIPIGEEPLDLLKTLNVRHLTLKTSMRSFEFDGIIFMLKCCPLLETLTINNLRPARIFPDDVPPFELDPEEFWTNNLIVHRCIKTSLKVVEVLGFQGTGNEILMLHYLISFGSVLEEVNLYLSEEDDGYGGNSEQYLQIAESMQRDIQRASHRLRIYIY